MTEVVTVQRLYANEYQWAIFGCGLSVSGFGDATADKIKAHAASGCEGCRDYIRTAGDTLDRIKTR